MWTTTDHNCEAPAAEIPASGDGTALPVQEPAELVEE